MFNKKVSIIFGVLWIIYFTQCIIEVEMLYATCPFKVKISSDKMEYLTREPISVNYEVKNITDSAICLGFNEVKDAFKIKDQLGQGYSNIMISNYFICPDTLEANEAFTGSEGIDSRYRINKAGEYTCFLDFYGCKSNILKIIVKDPSGDEKKALELLKEAEKLSWCKDKDPEKRELGFSRYQELADKYPKSIYAPQSLSSAILVYFYSPNIEKRRKAIPVCRRLIESYPNSLYFNSAFMSLVDVYEILKDKEGAIKIMNELIEKHPDTKISEEAERRLKRIKEWKF